MWQKLSSKKIFIHPRITLVEDKVQLPSGTIVPYLTFQHTNDSVTVICKKAGSVLLQREYSYPVNDFLYQFPGGKIEPGEAPAAAALRELQEESGYTGRLKKLGWYYVNNRRTAAKMHVFLATEISTLSNQEHAGDEEEDITSEWLKVEELEKKITNGDIVNFSVLAAWPLLARRT